MSRTHRYLCVSANRRPVILWAVRCLAALVLAGCARTAAAPMVVTTPVAVHTPAGPLLPLPNFVTPAISPIRTPISAPANQTPPGSGVVTVGLAADLPEEFATPLLAALNRISQTGIGRAAPVLRVLDRAENATNRIELVPRQRANFALAERFYAVVVPFATVDDEVKLEDLQLRWQGKADGPVFVTGDTAALLAPVLGPSQAQVMDAAKLLATLQQTPGALGILPFDQLDPSFKVLQIDGVDVLDNHLDQAKYPLTIALTVQGDAAQALADRLQGVIEPQTNRDATQLTSLIMTGVTAMSRGTAAAMERHGMTYPADIISATLRAADITHVSNEVPFLKDCVVNNTENNLVLCSSTKYLAALEAIGTDIVGLSGNHVNDFGRDGARESLQILPRS